MRDWRTLAIVATPGNVVAFFAAAVVVNGRRRRGRNRPRGERAKENIEDCVKDYVMAKDWIERPNALFAQQAQLFAQAIAADPSVYHIAPPDAALLAADYAAFADAYQTADRNETRTAPAIIARQQAREKLAARMRELGGRVRADSSIPTAAKMALTLTLPGRGPAAPQSPPQSAPNVIIRKVGGNWIDVRLIDNQSPTHFRKPRHIAAAEVFYFCPDDSAKTASSVSAANGSPPNDPLGDPAGDGAPIPSRELPPVLTDWRSTTTLSSKATLRLPLLPPGTKVWIAARWLNGRSQPGPIGQPVYVHVTSTIYAASRVA